MNRRLTLKDLGAEICNNLIEPIQCSCGCGNWGKIFIDDTEENNVFTVAGAFLEDLICDNAWIFIIEDWAVSGAYMTEDGIQYFTTAVSENEVVFDFEQQVEFAKAMIKEYKPYCIGVLQHTKDGLFRVVAEDIYDRWLVKGVKIKRKPRCYLN